MVTKAAACPGRGWGNFVDFLWIRRLVLDLVILYLFNELKRIPQQFKFQSMLSKPLGYFNSTPIFPQIEASKEEAFAWKHFFIFGDICSLTQPNPIYYLYKLYFGKHYINRENLR